MTTTIYLVILILTLAFLPPPAPASAETVNGTSSNWIDEDADEQFPTLHVIDPRRSLAQNTKYVSYSALKKNSVPCNKKGSSYYNCNSRQKANPYNRGCSKITNCYRYTNI